MPFHFPKAPSLPVRFLLLIGVTVSLVASGTMGYQFIEGWRFLDAFYMTVITLSTIGYGETRPLSDMGRLFTIALILGGGFTFVYALTEIFRTIVSGELAELLGKRQMEMALSQIRNHIIVCGYGRMGKLVCQEFSSEKVPFVVVDESEEELRGFRLPSGIPLIGDATSDDVLRHAGIDRARGLVTVMASDANNLFTTLSARLLNSTIYIVARAESPTSETKLSRAGANRVVSPYQIGGVRVAHAVLKPTVVDFIELATRTQHIELQMEEAKIAPNSSLVGRKLMDSKLRSDHHLIIVAIKRNAGDMIFNPASDTLLEEGDILVAIGHKEHLARLEALARSPST